METEIKVRLHDPERLRGILRGLGLRCEGVRLELNELLDTPAGRLRDAGCGLRVRVEQRVGEADEVRATLTFKGSREQHGNIKQREEIEFVVSDASGARSLLERLGYVPRLSYEKRRETWRGPNYVVTIDELPGLGWYAEVEAEGLSELSAAMAAVGVNASEAIEETYAELVQASCEPDAHGVYRLAF